VKKTKLRTSIAASGSFVSLPEAFPGADPGVKYAPKIQLDTVRSEDTKRFQLEHVWLPHRILIDLQAVDPDAFDPDVIVADCDIVKSIVREHPKKVQTILSAFQEGAPYSRIERAGELMKELGWTEKSVARRGGGFLWLLIILAAGCAGGCGSCRGSDSDVAKGIKKAGGK
jgi:hypothetical protein